MPITEHQHTVTDEQAGRVDLVVRDLTELSRSKLRGLFDHGCVTVNEVVCDDVAVRVAAGDVVGVKFDPHQGYKEKPKVRDDKAFKIVFEDEDMIVVNKEAGVLVSPASDDDRNTLIERVSKYLSHRHKNAVAGLVHRMERGASGLMVLAKTEEALTDLNRQFRDQQPTRSCIAVVMGTLEAEEGVFDSWLGTRDNLDSFSMQEGERGGGKRAITRYKLLKQQEETAVVEVQLETARRHQLRVHFAEAGHPVLGDKRYGRKKAVHDRWKKRRLAMHCHFLKFKHPITGELVQFQTPIPQAIRKFKAGP
jgi:23S rRNA pseudouridine1911/1915/1917 synthase